MGNASRTTEDGHYRELVAATAGRIDAVLAAAYPDLSRARLQRLIADGQARVNGVLAKKSHQVVPGDQLALNVPDTPHASLPTGFDLPILYEDEQLLGIDKPAGLTVHGAPGDTGPSVAAWILQRLGPLASKFDAERPGIVHRLDKDTSGVMLLAKTPAAQAALSAAFEARTTSKTYIAITSGVPDRPRAVIDAAIARHPGDRTRMAIANRGRESRTNYEVAGDDGEHALLIVRPETGRTHQIRVHLAAIGAPVLFDQVYGKGGEERQMLHAWQLSAPHPAGGTLTITAPLAADFRAAVRSLGFEKLALEYMEPRPPERES